MVAGLDRSAILDRAQQEFDIAFGPGDRARLDPQHGPALPFNPAFGLCADALMHTRIAAPPALAYSLAPCLELRLDQRHEIRAGLGKPQRRLEHLGERNE